MALFNFSFFKSLMKGNNVPQSTPRATVFVDFYNVVGNFSRANQHESSFIDAKKYVKCIEEMFSDYDVTAINFYLGRTTPSEGRRGNGGLINVLGNIPKCKVIEGRNTMNGEKETDMNLGCDLLEKSIKDEYDVAIIASGDTDFIPAIKKVKSHGKKVEIVRFNNHTIGLSFKLREIVDGVREFSRTDADYMVLRKPQYTYPMTLPA